MSAAEVMKLTPSDCLTNKCTRTSYARGYCKACYQRLRDDGTLEGAREKWLHRLTDIDPLSRTGTCLTCGPNVKLIKRGTTANWRCYETTKVRARAWKARRRAALRDVMLDHCEICGSKERLRWDHKHGTPHYRGTLCDHCNKGIGLFFENPSFLANAIAYLDR